MRLVFLSSALVMLLLVSIVPPASAAAPEWRSLEDMPEALTSFTTVELLDGRVLVSMGWDGGQVPSGETWIFDPTSGEWQAAADPPGSFMAASGVAMPDGRVYIFGGLWLDQDAMTMNYQEEVLIYDVEEDIWTSGAPRPEAVSMLEAAALDEERILLVGGLDSGMMATAACYIYDTVSDSFTATDDLLKPRVAGVALSYLGDVLYAGGSDSVSLVAMKEVFRYDASSGTWSLYGKMPEGRYYDEGAIGDDGLMYLYGGKTGATTDLTGTGTFRVVDMVDCSFITAPAPPVTVIGAGVVATGDGWLMLFGGGQGNAPIASVSSLRLFERDAWIDDIECAPGEGVRVHAEVQANFVEHDSYSMDVLLIKNGTVLSTERMTAGRDESASVYLEVPEDLGPGSYEIMVRNVEFEAKGCDIAFPSLTVNVTEAPSPTDRIGELEDQLAELRDELAGKMDAWVGYAILVIVIISLGIMMISIRRKWW